MSGDFDDLKRRMDGAIADAVKDDRLARLQSLLKRQQDAFNRSMAGRTLPVLLEREGRHPGQLVGRSPYMQVVHVRAAAERLGTVCAARITGVHPNSLGGELLPGAFGKARRGGQGRTELLALDGPVGRQHRNAREQGEKQRKQRGTPAA